MNYYRIALTSLSEYNGGNLKFEWIDLDCADMDEIKEVKERLGGEEFFISDYEAPFKIEEYEDIPKLIETVEFFSNLDDYDLEKALFIMNDQGYSKEDVADVTLDDIEYYQNVTLKELAEQFVDEGLFGEVAESLSCYIDYEAIARDLQIDGYTETDNGVLRYQ